MLNIVKRLKELSNSSQITTEEDTYFKNLQQELLQATTEEKNRVIHEIWSYLPKCELAKKVYLYTFLVDITGKKEPVMELIGFIENEERLSPETKYCLYGQIKYKLFVGKVVSDIEINSAMYRLLEQVVKEFRGNLNNALTWIPEEKRNKNRVLVVAEQILSLSHGPTKSALARAAAITKMGKQVLLLNTAEQMSGAGAIYGFDFKMGHYDEENSELEYIDWKGTMLPFFQCDNNMPNIEVIEYLLDTVRKINPYYVVCIGGDGIFVSLLNEMLPVLAVGMVPSAIGTSLVKYQTLGRKITDIDREYLQEIGKTDTHIIEHKFTSDLREQNVVLRREDVGIKENAFVLVTVGGRLEEELSEEFFWMIEQILEIEEIELVVLGMFKKKQEVYIKHPRLEKNIRFLGAVDEVLAHLELCDIYVNPIRTGGGTSCVEAMFKGLPVVTTDQGDVAVNAGSAFTVKDYEEMKTCIIRYKKDAEFYERQAKKARKRAEELLDTDRAFREVIKEFSLREGLEVD